MKDEVSSALSRLYKERRAQGKYIREISSLFLFISDRIYKIYRIISNKASFQSPQDSSNLVNLVNPVKKSEPISLV